MGQIAVILQVHGNTEVVSDTIDAIRTWVSDDILVVVDGAAWTKWGSKLELPAYILEGFIHNNNTNPFRNITLGLMHAVKQWPDAEWYCMTEYDVLFTSDSFKEDLNKAAANGVWCIGNDSRAETFHFELLEKIVGSQLEASHYLLGCCVFYHRDFIQKLTDINFFERLLYKTNGLNRGFFPGCGTSPGCDKRIYSFVEHLYPTLAVHFGGKVEQFASWNGVDKIWNGNGSRYPMRWIPDIDPLVEDYPNAAIVHPVKEYNHPIREIQRLIRYARQFKL